MSFYPHWAFWIFFSGDKSPGWRQMWLQIKFSRASAEWTVPPWLKCPRTVASILGLHLRFQRQSSHRKQPALSATCTALHCHGPSPWHSVPPRGQIIPQRASCQSLDTGKCFLQLGALGFAGIFLLGPRVQIEYPFERVRGNPRALLWSV